MSLDRFTKPLLAVAAAASLAVLVVRSAAQQPVPASAPPPVPAAQPAGGTASLQISATPEGFLALDTATGEVLNVALKDKAGVTVVGTLRKGTDGRWDFALGKGNGAVAGVGADALKIVGAQASVAKLMTALAAYKRDTGRLPSTEEGLQALVVQPPAAEGWKGPYLKEGLPKDPWGNPYVYRQPGKLNADGADVLSFGPDQRDGGGDDIFGR